MSNGIYTQRHENEETEANYFLIVFFLSSSANNWDEEAMEDLEERKWSESYLRTEEVNIQGKYNMAARHPQGPLEVSCQI